MQFKLFFVILAACCCLAAAPAAAQDDAPKGQLLSVHEDLVIPSMLDQYEKAAKSLAEMITKNNVGISYTAANQDNFVYIYFSPVENMAEVDKMGANWGELEKKVGKQNFDAAMKQFDGCYTSHKNYLIRLRPDLSYKPEYGSSIADGMLFRHWDFYYIHPGMEEAADNIAKEWVALSKKVGLPEGYRLYSGSYGSDTPVFIVVQSAKNALDFHTRQEAWLKKAGDDGKALWGKTWKVIRKFDSTTGMIRPDISVSPKDIMKK